jgi:hypothetical protein
MKQKGLQPHTASVSYYICIVNHEILQCIDTNITFKSNKIK